MEEQIIKQAEEPVKTEEIPAEEEKEELITNQDDFNKALAKRLERERAKQAKIYEEKYADYLSPEDLAGKTAELNKKISDLGKSLADSDKKSADYAQKIAELEAQLKVHETASVKSRIAHEVGIPYELANKLSGTTEEEIRKDAESFLPFISKSNVAPLRNSEASSDNDGVMAAFKRLNPNIKI